MEKEQSEEKRGYVVFGRNVHNLIINVSLRVFS